MALPILEGKKKDLELSMFATLDAIRGEQFGRDIYTTVIKFKDLDKFLVAFPEVQRNINPRKISLIKSYLLSGLEKDTLEMRFFSAVTCTVRGSIYYDDQLKRIAVDTNMSKLSINDGQHRINAIAKTLEDLENDLVKSRKKERTERIHNYIKQLKEMVIPVIIFDGMTEENEKQLFHDLNNLAQRPSRNTNILLNQQDLFSRMAREIALENRYFVHYGVEFEKQSIMKSNPNTFTLGVIYESIKELLMEEYNYNRKFLTEENYKSYKDRVEYVLNSILYTLPGDINDKKYMFNKSYTLKAICKFYRESKMLDLQLTDDQFLQTIQKVDWTYNYEFWKEYGAIKSLNNTNFIFGGTNGGVRNILNCLMDKQNEL